MHQLLGFSYVAYKFLDNKKIFVYGNILFLNFRVFSNPTNFLMARNIDIGSFICVNCEWSLTCNENYLSTTLRTYNFPSLFLQKICIRIISTDSSFQLTNVLRNYSDVKAQIFYFLWYWDRERKFPKRIYFDKKRSECIHDLLSEINIWQLEKVICIILRST